MRNRHVFLRKCIRERTLLSGISDVLRGNKHKHRDANLKKKKKSFCNSSRNKHGDGKFREGLRSNLQDSLALKDVESKGDGGGQIIVRFLLDRKHSFPFGHPHSDVCFSGMTKNTSHNELGKTCSSESNHVDGGWRF